MGGAPLTRYGNRHPQFVLHGCFRCAGVDNWIVVAATDQDMWQRLAILIGRPDWATDESLRSAEARRSVQAVIERGIEAWTLTRDADQAMSELQAARVAAGVARLPIDLLDRVRFCKNSNVLSLVRIHSPQCRFEGAGLYAIRTAATTLGQHNREILSGLLGLSDGEIAQFARQRVIGTSMLLQEELARSKEGRHIDISTPGRD